MALESIFNVVQSDSGYQLNFTLNDSSGSPVNLTGATLAINIQMAGSPALKVAAGAVVIDNALLGTCHYAVQVGDFDVPGTYNAQIKLTNGSQILTWSALRIDVAPVLPRNY